MTEQEQRRELQLIRQLDGLKKLQVWITKFEARFGSIDKLNEVTNEKESELDLIQK